MIASTVIISNGLTIAEFAEKHADRLRGHVELVDVHDAGLTRATGVARNPVTIDRIELLGICGSLSERDRAEVLDTFLPFGASVAD